VPRIEEHTVGLAQQLHAGLVKQGYKMFTPPGNRSSIVTFFITKPADAWRAALEAAKIDVTVRNTQVRVSPGLFNNADEIDQLMSVTKKLS
jgi:selenocysteine lyase/cysteine desulfurase